MDLTKEIQKRSDELLDELIAFCRIPSISSNKEGIDDAVKFIDTAAKQRGIVPEHLESPANPMVYFHHQGSGKSPKTLLYYCHYDVVPVGDRSLWSSEPFGGAVIDGKVYCRGVSDHKGSMLARLQAIGIVQELLGELPVSVKMIAEGEEELGSPYLEQVVEQNLDKIEADACFYSGWYRNEFDQVRVNGGSRGSVSVELSCEVAEKDLHGAFATLVPDPAIRLAAAVGTIVDSHMTCKLPGFYDSLSSITPSDRAALNRIPFEWETFKRELGIHKTVDLEDKMQILERHVFYPTVGIAEFAKSGKRGVVPAWARVDMSFRLAPGMDPRALVPTIEQHLAANGISGVKVRASGRMGMPSRIPVDHWLLKAVVQSGRRVFGYDPVVYPVSSGSGPRYIFNHKGIPTIANIGPGYAGSNDHAPNENVRVADYLKCVEHETDILMHGLSSEDS